MRIWLIGAGFLAMAWMPAGAVVPTVPARPVVVNDFGPRQNPPDFNHEVVGLPDGRVCAFAEEGFTVYAMPSADGGVTFGPQVLAAGRGRSADVIDFRVIGTEDGRIYLLLVVVGPVEGRGIQLVRSEDGGQTWGPVVDVVAGSGSGPLPRLPQIAADVAFDVNPQGRAAIAFMMDGFPYARASVDGGVTWSEPVLLSSVLTFDNIAGVAVGLDGTIYVARYDDTSIFERWPMVQRSTDGGVTFSPPVSLEDFEPESSLQAVTTQLRAMPDGAVLLLTAGNVSDDTGTGRRVRVYRSVDAAQSFVRTLDQEWSVFASIAPVISCGGQEVVVLGEALHATGAHRLFARRSGDGGATFGAEEVLDGSGTLNTRVGELRGVPLAGGGWHVSWVRLGLSPELWRSAAVPGGPWSGPIVSLLGGQHHGAAASGGAVVLAWPEDADVHVARVAPADPVVSSLRVDTDGPPIPAATGQVILAADGADHVYAFTTAAGGDVHVSASADRGRTFGPPQRVTQGPHTLSTPFRAAAATDGRAYVVYGTVVPGFPPSPATLWIARTEDFGATWHAPQVLAMPARLDAELQLAALPGGMLSVAWVENNAVWTARSSDGGVTFTTAQLDAVAGPTPLALCRSGMDVTLAWRGTALQILARTSADGGSTWSPAELLGQGRTSPVVTCAAGGRSLVVWNGIFEQVELRRHGPAGWMPLQPLPIPTIFETAVRARQSGDHVYIVTEAPSAERRIDLVRSSDGGATFDPAVRIDADLARPNQFSFSSSVVAEQGRVWVLWFDEAHGPASFLAVRRSDDAGVTWGPTRRIDRETAPGGLLKSVARDGVAVASGALLVAWKGRHHLVSLTDALLNADDVFDQDRDGVPVEEDCDDTDPDVATVCGGNQPPVAEAGPDQLLECAGDLSATALLDGTGSGDPDGAEDLASFLWQEGETVLATSASAQVSFALGVHPVRLTVTDLAGESGTDAVQVEVVDTEAPSGGVTFPAEGACFGPDQVPITAAAAFGDTCDPAPELTWTSSPGPFAEHGNHTVAARSEDASGLATTDTVTFTIDLAPPTASLALSGHARPILPLRTPLSLLASSADEDGAAGGVVHEMLLLEGCTLLDGATHGDGDGLLSDEPLALTQADLCQAADRCGWALLVRPVLTLRVTDCAGNAAWASTRLPGSLSTRRACTGGSAAVTVPRVRSLGDPARPAELGR